MTTIQPIVTWFSTAIPSLWNMLYSETGWLGLFVLAAFVIRLAWKYIEKIIVK